MIDEEVIIFEKVKVASEHRYIIYFGQGRISLVERARG
jgi:hypothetical protein